MLRTHPIAHDVAVHPHCPELRIAAREAGKCDLDSGQPGAQLQVVVLLLRKKGKTNIGATQSLPLLVT